MKNPLEWDEDDLLEMVKARTQESIELDFKESGSLQATDKKKDDISKDVSAFANSAGGTIIYGMIEDKVTHVATGLDTGSDPADITKEWLEQVINSKIHRRIDGVRIRQIELTTTHPGRVAYVVNIPSSTRAPHQASDKRFYKRFNFQSVPMEEYEIRDVSRRGETPDLRIDFALPKTELIPIPDTTAFNPISLQAVITNDALEPAKYAIIKVFIDVRLDVVSAQGVGVHIGRNSSITIGDKELPGTMLTVTWGIPGKLPIFHAVYSIFDSLLLKIPTDGRMANPKYYLIGYEIKSPRMPIKDSYALLEVRSGYIWLAEQHLTEDELLANYSKLER